MISRSTKERSSARNSRWSSSSSNSMVSSVARWKTGSARPSGKVAARRPRPGRRSRQSARRRAGCSSDRALGEPDPGDDVRRLDVGPRRAVHHGARVDDARRRDAAASARWSVDPQAVHSARGGCWRCPQRRTPARAAGARGSRPTRPAVTSSGCGTSAGTSPVHPQQRRWRAWTGCRRCRARAATSAPATWRGAALAAQLADRLDQQQHAELAGVAVGQPAAGGVERQRAAGPDPAVLDEVGTSPRPQKPERLQR